MKILLVSLQDNREQLGLKTLHYHLMSNGYESLLFYFKLFDEKCEDSQKAVKDFLIKIYPAFIGVSLMSIDYKNAIAFTKIVREVLPQTPVVWGGIHPSIYPEMCLQYADYVAIGESEKTLLDLAKAAKENSNFEKINNVAFLKNGKIVKNELNPPLENLDSLSSFEHIAKNGYVLSNKKVEPLTFDVYKSYDKTMGNTYSVVSSRGCPFSCTYCCNNFYKNLYNYKKIRRRTVDSIINELVRAVNEYRNIKFINFEDDSFVSGSIDYIKEFAEKYSKKVKKPFIVHSIPVSISEDKIILLRKAGLAWVNVGLQTGSDYILNEIYKRKSLKEDFLKATQILKKHKVAAFYDVLVDNPYENQNDRIATLETVLNIPKPYIIRVFSLTFYPGSELYERFIKDFPEHADAYLDKNFCLPTNKNYNHLLKMMPFLFNWLSYLLLIQYKKNPEGNNLKLLLLVIRYINVIFIKPLRHLKLIHMSYQGNYLKTFNHLPFYIIHYFSKHLPANKFLRNKGILPF